MPQPTTTRFCIQCNQPIPARVRMPNGTIKYSDKRKICIKCKPFGIRTEAGGTRRMVWSHIWAISDDDVKHKVREAVNIRHLMELMGIRDAGGSRNTLKLRLDSLGISWDTLTRGKVRRENKCKKKIEEYLVEHSTISRDSLKIKLVKAKLLDYRCYSDKCAIIDSWLGNPLSLHLDHINGVPNDNRLDNLRFLCPNCHSQTPTYAGKKRKDVYLF